MATVKVRITSVVSGQNIEETGTLTDDIGGELVVIIDGVSYAPKDLVDCQVEAKYLASQFRKVKNRDVYRAPPGWRKGGKENPQAKLLERWNELVKDARPVREVPPG